MADAFNMKVIKRFLYSLTIIMDNCQDLRGISKHIHVLRMNGFLMISLCVFKEQNLRLKSKILKLNKGSCSLISITSLCISFLFLKYMCVNVNNSFFKSWKMEQWIF